MDDQDKDEYGFKDQEVSVANVLPFCNQLEKFIKYIGNIRDLNFLTYEYPNILQNRLNADVIELETILAEIKEAVNNTERLRNQRKSIKKEKIQVKKILKRMRDDEVREMECEISSHDNCMFSRWENARTAQKPEVLEVMLTDIKGKQLALDKLTVLVTRKLNQIQVFQPLNTGEANNEKNAIGSTDQTIIPLPFPSFSFTPSIAIPPPPPLPPPPIQGPVSYLPKRSHAQRLTIQRRRRLERRDEEMERSPIVEDLRSVPLILSNLSNDLPGNLYPTIWSPISNSSQDVISNNSGAVVRNSSDDVTLLTINDNNNNSNVTGGLGMEFQSEMRTVLQALFGDLRSAPTLLVTESTSSDVTEADNASNSNREIELYTLRKAE